MRAGPPEPGLGRPVERPVHRREVARDHRADVRRPEVALQEPGPPVLEHDVGPGQQACAGPLRPGAAGVEEGHLPRCQPDQVPQHHWVLGQGPADFLDQPYQAHGCLLHPVSCTVREGDRLHRGEDLVRSEGQPAQRVPDPPRDIAGLVPYTGPVAVVGHLVPGVQHGDLLTARGAGPAHGVIQQVFMTPPPMALTMVVSARSVWRARMPPS